MGRSCVDLTGPSGDSEEKAAKKRRQSKWDTDSGFSDAPSSGDASQASQALLNPQAAAAAAAVVRNNLPLSQRHRIFVGSIPYSLEEEQMRQIFSTFGTVIAVDLPREGEPLRSKGFCYIEFTKKSEADLAIASMQDFFIAGRKLRVSRPTNSGMPDNVRRNGLQAPSLPPSRPPLASPGQGLSPMEIVKLMEKSSGTTTAAQVPSKTPLTPSVPAASGKVIALENLVGVGEVDDDLEDEVREECARFGEVKSVKIHELVHCVRIFVAFNEASAGAKALKSLDGRPFGDRKAKARAYPEQLFDDGKFNFFLG
eukprot:gnl/TRDRNA2_/TRDRNA2_87599_c0_seq1.p1 gnl/TRDRNA2_/TRDRNA2_87599_c0~~gnl/TRDRNA2_/TRDRNA2_87599_c0_seq1.p1  ORF type:complete len:312 (-),score=65.64 gnl/TRDRNA2_/TRDRNA2_87599_c0_seq1:24-959(-)